MKLSRYRERDHVFGQMMLTLRSVIGMTQTELAKSLGISRRAVGDWEAGISYPKKVF
jgi:DNA-binding XRE family transcriptional regulator